ncbi:hypothetical protein GCM10010116_55610 [Microbispora rosea subsp. aerata]|nr:hypothetical protein [Microbispora rosea]GGO27742.1 hypothetical protein GCM10010116_55610 [Microbispora rosea subsp. aerata]GIH56943.1 hypothetical protein Mro02_38570 [Microbispora rosea subsp. aerata]GLJ82870.1 hypothetical protein GCM10017588_15960 [Microbispora rosea subsp. aerata]
MPNLKKIFAGLAVGSAIAGGAVAMGATAASAEDHPFKFGGNPFSFEKEEEHSPTVKKGDANAADDSTGGIAQGNNKGNGFPTAFAPKTDREHTDQHHNRNDRNQNNWWDTNNWWGQNLYNDDRSAHDAFGLVAKDVAFGFQEKDNRDFNWINQNWWADQNWWDFNNNDWWHRNDRQNTHDNGTNA